MSSPPFSEPGLPLAKVVLMPVVLGLLLVVAVGYSHDCGDDGMLVQEITQTLLTEVRGQIRAQSVLSPPELATALSRLPEIHLSSVKRRGEYLRVAISPEDAVRFNIPQVHYFHVRYGPSGYQLRGHGNAFFYYRSLF